MAQQAFFVSETWLKNNTVLPYNLDIKDVYPFIKVAQDFYVKDALGDALYDRLVDGIINSNLTGDETNLIELIRQSLAYYIIYAAIPFLDTKISNIGIVSTTDDKQAKTDAKTLADLRKEILNIAEYYMQRVKRFLCNNPTMFPEYTQSNKDVSPSHETPFNCDLFLDDEFIKKYKRS